MEKRIIRVIEAERKDNKEALTALRLQVHAWRLTALIATADPKEGIKYARWLFFHTVPVVNADVVSAFITEHTKQAEQCGKQSGVFDKDRQREAPP